MKKLKYNKKGITLIALVLTIVVLLILAGASLNLIAGGDGIIAKASKAVEETKRSSIKSQIELTIAQWYMEYYTSGIELEGRSELLDSGSKITYYSDQIIYEDKKQTYIANLEDGKIETLEIATTKNSQYYNSR